MLPLPRLTRFRSPFISLTMPATRSRSKATTTSADQQPGSKLPRSGRWRKVTPDEVVDSPVAGDQLPPKKPRLGKQPVLAASAQSVGTVAVPIDPGPPPSLVPAELCFSFEDAKRHLITTDGRFQDVFTTAVCTPYQKLDRVEPFR